MKENIHNLKDIFLNELNLCSDENSLKEIENNFLGKEGSLKNILKGIKDLSNEEKKEV
jgi:phenylalanyl-tRNA synthetase alpha chain